MSSFLRRLPLSRLLLLCGAVLVIGASGAALASAVTSGPVPAPKPLAQAVHDALGAAPVEGISARIQYTNRLLEGANLASGSGEGGQLASSPLLQGATGRLWVAKDGRARLELQANGGDTEVVLDDHVVSIYGAAPDTVYRYTLPQYEGASEGSAQGSNAPTDAANGTHEAPTVSQIEEAISHLSQHAVISGATPGDVAGQPAYTVRISPKETGSLLGGAELSWDAVHGLPLRAALYSSSTAAPVIELAATEVSYGPVESSVFEINPPAGAKIVELGHSRAGSETAGGTASETPGGSGSQTPGGTNADRQSKVRTVGRGITSVLVVESPTSGGSGSSPPTSGMQKVKINGTIASELPTALGTLLRFERSGVSYLLVGAVKPAVVEGVARGL
jgi:outer membrane lipoprotein-sorting protein